MARQLDDMNRAIMKARDLPFGSARNEVAAALVREVTTEGPQEARAFALFALTESYAFSDEVEKAYLPFTQSVRLWDEHPELFDQHDVHSLFWSFKWMVGNLMEFPAIPAAQITSTLDDMRRRYQLAGNGMSAVNHLTFQWHHLLGDDELPAAYERWITTERDDFSQCPACEPGDRTAYLFEAGRYEEGIRLLESAEATSASCHSEPADRLSQLQLAYLEVGDAEGAARAHRHGLQSLPTSGELAGAQGRHVQLLARSGNHSAAWRFLDRSAGLLTKAETPADRLSFLLHAGTGVSVLRRHHPLRAVSYPGVPATTVAELDDWMHGEALELAAAFDRRGGTSASTERVLRAWSGRHSELRVDLSVLTGHGADLPAGRGGDLTAGRDEVAGSGAPDAPAGSAAAAAPTGSTGSPVGADHGTGAGDVPGYLLDETEHDGAPAGAPSTVASAEPSRDQTAGRAGVGPDALVSAAESSAARGETVSAARLYAQAAEMFEAIDEPEAAGFALAEAAALAGSLGDDEGAESSFREALALLARAETGIEYTGPVARAYARVCVSVGAVPTAVSVLGPLVAAAEIETAAARGAVQAVAGAAEAEMADEATTRARRATVLAAEHAQLLDTLARAQASAGQTDEATAAARTAAEAFAELGMVEDAAHAFWLAGRLDRAEGRLEDAVWLLESAAEGFAMVRSTAPRAEVTGELVEVLTALGRTSEAEDLVRRLSL